MVIDLDRVGKPDGPAVHKYSGRDVILYHLGIGAGADDLDLVYEGAPGGLKVCPTWAVVPTLNPIMKLLARLNVPLTSLLHGEQAIFLDGAIPAGGTLFTTSCVRAVHDKGKAAVVVIETMTTDEPGKVLFRTRASFYCKGLGGFGGEPGPRVETVEPPGDRPPDFETTQATSPAQAALYRLSGDDNPLHIDPAAASLAGFSRPILHGLCTFGFVGRAVLARACGNRIEQLKELGVRFAAPVYPGDAITTQGWHVGGGRFRLRVASQGREVLSNAWART